MSLNNLLPVQHYVPIVRFSQTLCVKQNLSSQTDYKAQFINVTIFLALVSEFQLIIDISEHTIIFQESKYYILTAFPFSCYQKQDIIHERFKPCHLYATVSQQK